MTNLHLVLGTILLVTICLYLLFEGFKQNSAKSLIAQRLPKNVKELHEQEPFRRSMMRDMRNAHICQAVIAIMAMIASLVLATLGFPKFSFAVLICLCLATWHFSRYRSMKIAEIMKKDVGVHNNGLIRCLSVIPVRDVDMNKVDKQIDKQLSEMEKMRRR